MDEPSILLTIFLKHDQSQNIDQIQEKLAKSEWWRRFPPESCEIVSWTVAMGLGQIVTLKLPPSRLATVNVEIERCAWGVFSTEFYPTYDFVDVRSRLRREWEQSRAKTDA